jgi:hypothetical protein
MQAIGGHIPLYASSITRFAASDAFRYVPSLLRALRSIHPPKLPVIAVVCWREGRPVMDASQVAQVVGQDMEGIRRLKARHGIG